MGKRIELARRLESLEARELLTVTALESMDTYFRASPRGLLQDGDTTWFSVYGADLENQGQQLWKTDGTSEGTTRAERTRVIADFLGNTTLRVSDDVANLINTNDEIRIYTLVPFGDGFAFFDSGSQQVWVSDGSVEGTRPITEPLLTYGVEFLPAGDDLYIVMRFTTTLLKWTPGAESLAEVHDFSGDGRFNDIELRQFGDDIWVNAKSDSEGQLWKLDPATDEVSLVHDSTEHYPSWSDVSHLEDGRMLFTVGTAPIVNAGFFPSYEFSHQELWITDGTMGAQPLVSLDDGRIIDVLGVGSSVYYVMLAGDGNFDLMRLDLSAEVAGQPEKIYDFSRLINQADDALHQVGDTIVFSDGSDLDGQEMSLYRFDTTTGDAKVEFVRSFDAGFASTLVTWSEGTLFTANDGSGDAIWTSDGTAEGTTRLADVDLLYRPRRVSRLLSMDDHLLMLEYHPADTSSHLTRRVWSSDGTGNLELIANVPLDTEFVSQGDPLDDDPTCTTFVTDGTRGGSSFLRFGELPPLPKLEPRTEFVREPVFTFDPNITFRTNPKTVGDTTFFVDWTEEHGVELWATSPSEGERLVRDINPGGFDSNPRNFVAIDGILYFSAMDRTTTFQFGEIETVGEENWELWRSDGTEEGTFKLAELNPAPEAFPASTSSSDAGDFRPVDRGFMFTAVYDGTRIAGARVAGQGWFSSDGTIEGTIRLEALDNATEVELPGAESGYFVGSEGLYFTDGSVEGTTLIARLPISGTYETATAIGALDGLTYFATDHSDGVTIWRTDGTAENTAVLETFEDVDSKPLLVTPNYNSSKSTFNDSVYFATLDRDGTTVRAFDGTEFQEIIEFGPAFRLSGIEAGSTASSRALYRDVNTGAPFVWQSNDVLLVVQVENSSESQRWVTDGTSDRRVQVERIRSSPNDYHFDGERLWFVIYTDDRDFGEELWVTDGTQEGTLFYDIMPGRESSYPLNLVSWRGDVYFTARITDPETDSAVTRTWKSGPAELAADFNDDEAVDFADFLALSHNFGREDASRAEGDTNGDGKVDFADFLELAHTYNQRQPESLDSVEPIQRNFENVEEVFAAIVAQGESN